MTTLSQLEIISPGGDTQFHDLDPLKGVVNIGRHPDNDVVIDGPGVALFHAVLDHRQKPYQIMLLSEEGATTLRGQRLVPNAFQELHDWDTVEIDGYALILLEGAEEAAVPPPPLPPVAEPATVPEPEAAAVAPLEPVGLPARPPDQTDEVVVAELSEREWIIEVEQMATCQLTVANGGSLVATFAVRVEGLDEDWVTISPPQVNLYEGGRATVTIAMEPPRLPTSSAGPHHLAVVVTSPNYPGRVSRLGATLRVNPYYEFTVGELSPKQQTVSWRKRSGLVTLPVTNKGNSETPFRLDGEDDERGCRFEYEVPGEEARLIRQAEFRLPPATAYHLPVYVTPIRRRLIALRKRTYSFTLTTSLVEGAQAPRSVMGQVKSAPLIGPWLLLLMALCLAALLVVLFRPARELELSIAPSNPDPGEAITLSYDAKRFPRWSPRNLLNRLNGLVLDMRLDFRPVDGEWQSLKAPSDFEEIVGQFTDTPPGNGKYQLRANTWLSRLIPRLESTPAEVLVFVTPVEPKIVDFRADPGAPLVGQEIMVSWKVENAEFLRLEYQGVEETLQDAELESGSRPFTLEQATTFTLIASNSSWEGEKKKPLEILVGVPTRTPIPTPVIVRFDVDPLSILEGDTVRVSWQVTGADTVSIEPIGGDFLLEGDVGHQPTTLTNYKLTAIKTAEDGTQAKNTTSKEVFVEPLPTETPEPVPPEIQLFKALPEEVILGDDQEVKLTWSVSGETTNIEITAPNLKLAGLEAQDVITVTVKETTLFVLTAYNGDLSRSVPAEVTVLEPTPTETPEPPPTPLPTPIPPPVLVYYRAEGLNPPADKVAFRASYQIESGWVYEYEVQAGSMAKLSWKVTNADVVELQDFGPQPAESSVTIPDPIVEARSYMLTAENEDPEYGTNTVNAFVKLELVPRPPPPPAYNLGGKVATDKDGNPLIELTWFYDRGYIAEIDGFRVYRADVSGAGPGGFEPVAVLVPTEDDPWTNRSKFSWQDTLGDVDPKGRTCGLAYYVVAFYWDVVANREKETDASTTSYYSPPCP
jgi:hypothetical protein